MPFSKVLLLLVLLAASAVVEVAVGAPTPPADGSGGGTRSRRYIADSTAGATNDAAGAESIDVSVPPPQLEESSERPQSRALVPSDTDSSTTTMSQQPKDSRPATSVSYYDYIATPTSTAAGSEDSTIAVTESSTNVLSAPTSLTTEVTRAPSGAQGMRPRTKTADSAAQRQGAASSSSYDAVSYGSGHYTYQVPVYVHKDDDDDVYRVLLEQFQKKITSQAGEVVSTTGMVVKNALKTQELAQSKFDKLLPYMLAIGAMFAFSSRNKQ